MLWELIVFADVGGAVRVAHMECGVHMAPLAAGKGSRCKGVIPIISQPGDCFWGFWVPGGARSCLRSRKSPELAALNGRLGVKPTQS